MKESPNSHLKSGRFEKVGTKILRCGYTTGTAAAGASAAAFTALLTKKNIQAVKVKLPGGEEISLEIESIAKEGEAVKAEVIKDGGDDVDITDGISIFATVNLTDTPGIKLIGGKGIGKVTKPGLTVPVGEAAINPVPRKMILDTLKSLAKEYHYDLREKGLTVTLSIPEGIKLAKQTFNPKLGIIGGLSILGTTGIVRPMSVEAIIATQKLELSQRAAELKVPEETSEIVFVFGNYGEAFAEKLGIDKTRIIKVSNYLGEMLDEAVRLRFRKILLIGDIGKLVKVAGGIFRTHSSESDAKMEILTSGLALLGAPISVLKEVYKAPTTIAAIEIIEREGFSEIYEKLIEKIAKRSKERVKGAIDFEVILFSRGYPKRSPLAVSLGAESMIKDLKQNR